MKSKYMVWVDMNLIQDENGQQEFDFCVVDDAYQEKLVELVGKNEKEVTSTMIDARVEALIAGLANCMFLADTIKHKKTHESLVEYIAKLEAYFSNARLNLSINNKEIKKEDEDIKKGY